MKQAAAEHRVNKALVVGLGVSGQAVCELMVRRGIKVLATDKRPPEAFADALERLRALGCELTLGGHDERDFLSVDQIVVSPGVPDALGPLVKAVQQGIEVIGELEWAWRQVRHPVVAVSGTNGKTTTTTLVGELLQAAGKRTFVGGNIGTPLTRWLLDQALASNGCGLREQMEVDYLVLEVSSFQLDTAPSFAPRVGVLLNVTEDHLDRYQGFSGYVKSKASLFKNQGPDDAAILNLDDPVCRELMGTIRSRVLTFSRQQREANATCREGRMQVTLPNRPAFSLDLSECPLSGAHNEENLMAAVLCAALLDLKAADIQKVLPNLRPLAHRIEWVGHRRGVDFYDDSKGTNIGAVAKAIEGFNKGVVLLMGGRDKGGSYQTLESLVRERVKFIACFGEAGPRLRAAMAGWAPAEEFADLETAFNRAVAVAATGDVVLLSPGCASFDQYTSYAERGNHFQQLVGALEEQASAQTEAIPAQPVDASGK